MISYMICATPRSGSTLLCEALRNTGLAGDPDEYFLPFHQSLEPQKPGQDKCVSDKYPDPVGYSKDLLKKYTSDNGVFGVKMMFTQLITLIETLRLVDGMDPNLTEDELIRCILPNPYYIQITRRDKIRQAVSMAKAVQTNQWFEVESWLHQASLDEIQNPLVREKYAWLRATAIAESKTRAPVYDYNQIVWYYSEIDQQEKQWLRFFDQNHVDPYHIEYESLEKSYDSTSLEILSFLGIPIPDAVIFQRRVLRKQSDQINEDWVEQL